MKLDYKVDAGRLYDRLRGIEEFADAPRTALVEVADLRIKQQVAWLRTAPWKPLKPESARRKAKRGRTTRPLLGGDLERSLSRRGAKFAVRRLNKRSVVVGTRDPVANLHQKGSRGGRLPARPVVRVSTADAAEFRQVFADRVASAVSSGRAKRRLAA